ncbi:unnamed protein product, partial [Prorocentrum cordatum]
MATTAAAAGRPTGVAEWGCGRELRVDGGPTDGADTDAEMFGAASSRGIERDCPTPHDRDQQTSSRDIAAIQAKMRARDARLRALQSGRGASSAASTAAGSRHGPGSVMGAQPDPWMAYHMQRGGAPPPSGHAQDRPSCGLGENAKHVVFVACFPGAWDTEEAKVVFAGNQQIWSLMKRLKELEISCPGAKTDRLWHTVDQEPREAPEVKFSDAGRRRGQAKGILAILTDIIEDLQGEIALGRKQEEVAQLEHEKQ